MKTRKILALLVASAMVFSMAACGDDATQAPVVDNTTAAPTEEPSAEPVSALPTDASVDFENGSASFAGFVSAVGGTGAADLSVADFNGSKALKMVYAGKKPAVSFDLGALLGDKVADVATIEFTVGIDTGATFKAASGKFVVTGGSESSWSVYLDTANPKRYTYAIPEGVEVANGSAFTVALTDANAGADATTVYIDNVAFKDAAGNIIAADSAAEFALGGGNGPALDNLVDLNFTAKAGSYSQAGKAWADIDTSLIKPGKVLMVEYKSAAPVWFVFNGLADENGEGWGWVRCASDADGWLIPGATYSDGVILIPYESLAAVWGDGFENMYADGAELQGEGSEDWEILAVSVGTPAMDKLENAVDLGFSAKAGSYSQAGMAWADIASNFKPGTVLEVEYSSAAPIWFVYNGLTDENGEGWGWVRCASDADGWLIPGATYGEGKIQIPYESLAAAWGDGFETRYADGAELQGEGSEDWEIYSISIGTTPLKPLAGGTDLGFSAKGGSFGQAGKAWADIAAEFAPGCTLEIEYKCDTPIWFVFNGLVNDETAWGWVRCSSEADGWLIPGAKYGDGIMQVPYSALAAYWGDDFENHYADGAELQGEGQSDWEIYSIKVVK